MIENMVLNSCLIFIFKSFVVYYFAKLFHISSFNNKFSVFMVSIFPVTFYQCHHIPLSDHSCELLKQEVM